MRRCAVIAEDLVYDRYLEKFRGFWEKMMELFHNKCILCFESCSNFVTGCQTHFVYICIGLMTILPVLIDLF